MKKVLSLVLVLTLVLTSFSFAFAASSDIDGHEYEAAIKRLNALQLMLGDSQGFRPNDTITRAEYAALVVRALGEESTAKLLKGVSTGFTDVDSVGHWASGYIKVAVQKNLIKGYGNGLFGPNDKIKVVDALVLMTRALGYEPKAENLGGYPIGNLTVANELDINDGVDSPGTALATRGEVAQIFDNSLTVPFMVRTTWGDDANYAVPKEGDADYTFILNEIGANSVEGRVVSTPSFGGEDEGDVVLAYLDEDDKEQTTTVEKVEGADALLGHEVTIWINEDDEALLVEDDTDADQIFEFGAIEIDVVDGDDVLVDADDNEYELAADAKLVVNRVAAVDLTDLDDVEDEQGVVILNGDDEVAFVITFAPNDGDRVTAVSTKHEIVEFDSLRDLELEDYESIVIFKDGQLAELADIAEDDVLYYAKSNKDEDLLVRVYSDKVEGEVTKVASDDESIFIDGEEYALATACDYFGDAADLIGEEVVVLLDRVGDALFVDLVEEDEEESDAIYAIYEASDISAVTSKFDDDSFDAEFKMFVASDESVVFDVVTTDDLTVVDTDGDEIDIDAVYGDDDGTVDVAEIHDALVALFTTTDMLVSYELNEDGDIETITIIDADIVNASEKTGYTFDADRERLVKGSSSEEVDTNSVVFDISGDYAAYTYADLVDGNDYDFLVFEDEVIVIYGGEGFESADTAIAFYTGYSKVKDGFEVSLFKDGEEVELFIDEDDMSLSSIKGIATDSVVELTLDGDTLSDFTTSLSEYSTVATSVYVQKVTTSKVYVVNAMADPTKSKIDDAAATVYYLEDFTDFYLNDGDDTDILDKGDLDEYQMITIYVNSDDEVETIIIEDLDVLD